MQTLLFLKELFSFRGLWQGIVAVFRLLIVLLLPVLVAAAIGFGVGHFLGNGIGIFCFLLLLLLGLFKSFAAAEKIWPNGPFN